MADIHHDDFQHRHVGTVATVISAIVLIIGMAGVFITLAN